MDDAVVFLLILIVALAILWFLVTILVGTIVIWGGVLMIVAGSFAWGLKSKWSLLNSHEKVSGLVTLSCDGDKVRWQTREPAFQAFLETRKFATIGIGLGFVWIIVCTVFGHASKGWGIFSALVLTTVAMPFMIQGYSSLMRLKIVDCVIQAGYHLARAGDIAIIEGKIAATSKRMDFDFPLEHSKALQSFVESNAVALMSNLTPLNDEIAKLEADANGVLASLEDAERDLNRANKAYNDAVRVVTQSRLIPLIQGLEHAHVCLNAKNLTDLLAGRNWEDFKKTIAETMVEIENLCEVARNYKDTPNGNGRQDASGTPEKGMSRTEALEVLGLKEGCQPEEIKKAWRKESSKWNTDQRQAKYEPHILKIVEEQHKNVNTAKDVLLPKN